ncbi:E3 ubiquitin-protein ligase RNF10 [Phymastichus coffea]|uniref:E3 ubiquitin-protein ligase RNF10 n=1 Tax=Phymastichus coffea TaxID=108790 RepID=UPI00273C3A1B|nr:E3 ubiquitin-protein ligase RNF10 [Phymastichus coffea]
MDKKSKYQQPNLKATATDSKKSPGSDVSSSKLFPKSSRKREPTGTNSYPKYDQQRKSNAQKTKNFDKRPKPKGYYHGSSKEDSKVVEDESAELGSVMVQGSKKQNLNHLLNFHYPSRDVQSGWNRGRNGYSSHNNRWLPAVHRHKYNKEQFLQANCQFVVTAKGDYSLYLNNPDILVDWKLVQQIRVYSSENLSCPICLCPPVAGKMTRCGHVYCWPCILHYLALSDKQRKCPICYESIQKSDLKSVVEITENSLNIGDHITLRLMRRQKGSMLAVPVSDIEACPPTTFLSVAENSCQQVYSKLLLANDNDIINIIEAEGAHLQYELLEDPNSPENYFIEQALVELSLRNNLLLKGITELDSEKSVASTENVKMKSPETLLSPKEESPKNKNNDLNLVNNSDLNGQSNYNLSDNGNDIEPSTSSQEFYYFYQAEGKQNVYLHVMNIKMLEMQYGSLEKCPRLISGKLIEREVGSYTEELRSRMRYLRHLPLTSVFEIIEIDLQPPTVSENVIAYFEGQILSRQKKRKRRERDERKREKKITEEENKLMGKYPIPKVHIDSRKHFPQFNPDISEIDTVSPPESVVASSLASSPSICSSDDMLFKDDDRPIPTNCGRSFAQMVQTTSTNKSVAWPSRGTSRNFESNESNADSQRTKADPIDSELEEYVAPVYNQSLGEVVAKAFENSNMLNCGGRSNDSVATGKKKKKKGKSTVLFTTNMARTS